MIIFFLIPQTGSALSLRQTSDVVTRLKINTPSDHTIQFTMSGGIAVGTIQINFNEVVGSINDIDYRDIDFAYGQPGLEREQILLEQPSTNIWGVTLNPGTKILTLTFPNASGAPLVTGDRVIIKIGSHAMFGKPDNHILRQMINNETQGSKQVDITAGTDTGSLAIPLMSEDSIGVTGDILKLQLTAVSSSRILVTLLGGIRAATGYRIERSSDSVTYNSIAEIPQTKREYEDKYLEQNTTYYYRIVPFNTAGTLGVADQGVITTSHAATLPISVPSVSSTAGSQVSQPSSPVNNISLPFVSPIPSTVSPQETDIISPQVTQKPRESKYVSADEQKIISQTLSNISSLRFERTKNNITFFWKNPRDMKNREIVIQRSEKKFPRALSEGIRVYQGLTEQLNETGLNFGSTYYYAFFIADNQGIFSSGSIISVTIPTLAIPQPSVTPAPSPTPTTASLGEQQTITVNLASPIRQTVQPDQQKIFAVTNTDSQGGEQTLRVDIPKNLSDKPFDITIVPIAKTQSYLFDENLRIPQDKEIIGDLFDVSARQEDKHLKKFSKTIRLTFHYNEKLFKNVSPEKIKVHYWDPLSENWISLQNTFIDVEEKLVVAEVDVDHFTLFGVMVPKESGAQMDIFQKVDIRQGIPLDVAREIKSQKIDLSLGSIAMTYAGTLQSLVRSKKGWYAVRGEYVNICIPREAVPQSSEYLSVKIFSNEFVLTDDTLKKCFVASIHIPEEIAEYNGIFKIVTTNDRITKIPFTFKVMSPVEESLMVYGEQFLRLPLQNPASVLAFISMLLMLIGGGWYVVRRRFQYSQD